MIPTFIFRTWLLGLLSLGIIGGAAYFAHDWQQRSWQWDPILHTSVFSPVFGNNRETWVLAGAIALAVIALAGGPLLKVVLRLSLAASRQGQGPLDAPQPRAVQRLARPDGSELRVEFYGPAGATALVLTHGWGLNGAAWNHLKRDFNTEYQVVVWDEPGLGGSTSPTNRDYSLPNLARDLEAVLSLVGDTPAILVGHSIGGMIILTFCRLFPEALATKVAALVLTHTTPTNPVKTTSGGTFYAALQKPVLEPLMYLTIFFSPLLRLTNLLSYFNGSAHLSTMQSSFAGTETWQEVDFVARTQSFASPAILARGMLGMMHYDALDVLSQIGVPTLVVAGDKDTTTLPEASQVMKAGIPVAKMATLTPAKHMGFIEHHDAYNSMVKAFVLEVLPHGAASNPFGYPSTSDARLTQPGVTAARRA